MKNIQVIDGAVNCVHDIYAATDEEFALIFPLETDIAFIDEVYGRASVSELDSAFEQIWKRRVPQADANGIHGLLFYENPTPSPRHSLDFIEPRAPDSE